MSARPGCVRMPAAAVPSVGTNPTPTPRHRHALRWVVGSALVFVVLVVIVLDVVQRQADERWALALAHFQDSGWVISEVVYIDMLGEGTSFRHECHLSTGSWSTGLGMLQLRQFRALFGSRIEARIVEGIEPIQVEAVRDFLAAVEIELVGKP